MARPRKTGLEYFPFDVDFFSDEKIVCIAGEFGLKGEMIAIRLLCAVYRQGYFAVWDEQLKYKLAHELSGVSAELIEQVVQRLVKWGFFNEALFNSAKVLTSRGIQRRFFDAARKRTISSSLPHLLIDPGNPPPRVSAPKTPVFSAETPVSSAETPIKEKEIIKNTDVFQKSRKKNEVNGDPPESNLEAIVAELKASTVWCEAIARRYSLRMPDIPAWLDKFLDYCRCEGKDHTSLRDTKSHFSRWLPYEINKPATYANHDTKRQDSRLHRPAANETTARSAQDFKNPL